MHLKDVFQNKSFYVSSSSSLPLFLSHCYCIDHNNVSGDTPFHGHSSETELHKPFTTRSPWWMAGPPAKAPRPDRSAFLRDKYRQKDIRRVSVAFFSLNEKTFGRRRKKRTQTNIFRAFDILYIQRFCFLNDPDGSCWVVRLTFS